MKTRKREGEGEETTEDGAEATGEEELIGDEKVVVVVVVATIETEDTVDGGATGERREVGR